MELIEPPRIVERPEANCLGIRVITPFRGMARKRDELLDELAEWLRRKKVDDLGPFFARLHVIDMKGPMDLEIGVITPNRIDGDDRVHPETLPCGRYATLTYRGSALGGNHALIVWSRENDIALDQRAEKTGDHFACRYEAYLTDPWTEPRKTKRDIELNIRVAQS